MRYLEEFRDPRLAKALVEKIRNETELPFTIMEVCGSHTVAIHKYGIKGLLPDQIRLISGPGCPVCVTPADEIDKAIEIARNSRNIFCTFGDMMRVPGSSSTLEKARANGADIRILYSSMDSLGIAKNNPDKEVIFFGVGFETTCPTVAATILRAKEEGIKNFSIYSAHKLVPPALEVLVNDREVNIDAFLLPGHVSAIIGSEPYQFLSRDYKKPSVISGFEPLDILQSIWMIIKQVKESRNDIEIQYTRVVKPGGNQKAISIMHEVFEKSDSRWRGLGMISGSGLELRKKFEELDVKLRLSGAHEPIPEPPGCQCGDVLRGRIIPNECKLFGKACTPANPVGPCMVSSEGSCAAHYKYSYKA